MYQLEYLPSAKQDMTDIAAYISHELFDPAAAEKLIAKMVESAELLTEFPYINAIHYSAKPLKKEYRKLIVKNYIMFYWIDEPIKKVIIARVIYACRNYIKLLRM
jgi:addiction module RelE/StbE family toxin